MATSTWNYYLFSLKVPLTPHTDSFLTIGFIDMLCWNSPAVNHAPYEGFLNEQQPSNCALGVTQKKKEFVHRIWYPDRAQIGRYSSLMVQINILHNIVSPTEHCYGFE